MPQLSKVWNGIQQVLGKIIHARITSKQEAVFSTPTPAGRSATGAYLFKIALQTASQNSSV
jgi:hypothetical protein